MNNVVKNASRNYCVYIHTSPSGKKYVGQTGKKPEERWGKDGIKYLKKRNGDYMHPAFARAILKYGWDNIEHEIVASNLTREEADNLEILLIKELDTKNREHGYNLKDGGLGGGGFSEETLKKMSESHKGIKQSEETIRKRAEKLKGENNPMYGKHLSEETKQKIKESRKWYRPSEETKKKMSDLFKGDGNPNYGKSMSDEQKKKLSEALKGRTHSKETKKKISEAIKGENNPFYGKVHSEESKKKMSESHKGVNIGKDHFASKKVCQYDSLGILIKIWDCMSEAERELNIAKGSIYNCCKGTQKKAGGFIWRYADDEITDKYISWCNELHTGGNQKKIIAQYSLDGKFIRLFDSITEAGMSTGIDKGSISACCRQKSKTAGGFIWKYYEDAKNSSIEYSNGGDIYGVYNYCW